MATSAQIEYANYLASQYGEDCKINYLRLCSDPDYWRKGTKASCGPNPKKIGKKGNHNKPRNKAPQINLNSQKSSNKELRYKQMISQWRLDCN